MHTAPVARARRADRARAMASTGDATEARAALTAARELGLPWVEPWCALIEAGLGDGDTRALIPAFDRTGQHLGEAAARQLAGEDISGWWRQRGVVRPEAMVAVLVGRPLQ